MKSAATSMKKRFRYSYSAFDFAYNLLWPVKWFFRCRWCSHPRPLSLPGRHRLYAKGEDKFTREFDAVEFARNQRRLKMLVDSLIGEHDKFLAVYQQANAIAAYRSSEGSESEDSGYAKVPPLLSQAASKVAHFQLVENFMVTFAAALLFCWHHQVVVKAACLPTSEFRKA